HRVLQGERVFDYQPARSESHQRSPNHPQLGIPMTLRTQILRTLRERPAGVNDITARLQRAGAKVSTFEVHTWLRKMEHSGAVFSWRSDPATSSQRRGGMVEGGLLTYDAIERV